MSCVWLFWVKIVFVTEEHTRDMSSRKTGNEAYKISKCQNILLSLEFSWHHAAYFSYFIRIIWSKFIQFCTSAILWHKIWDPRQKKSWQLGTLESKADTSRFELNEVIAVGTTWIRGRQLWSKIHIPLLARILFFLHIRIASGDPPVRRIRRAFLRWRSAVVHSTELHLLPVLKLRVIVTLLLLMLARCLPLMSAGKKLPLYLSSVCVCM